MNSSVELCMTIASCSSKHFDRVEIVRLLTTADADINFQDANRNFSTPLHLAIASRNVELCKLLLSFTPNLRLRNMAGERPKDLAINLNLFEVVKLLDEHSSSTSSTRQIKSRSHYYDEDDSAARGNKRDENEPQQRRSDKIYASSRVQFLLAISKIDPHFKRTNFNVDLLRSTYSQVDENDSLRPLIKVAKEMPWLRIYYIYNQSRAHNEQQLNCTTPFHSNDAKKNEEETIFISGPQSANELAAQLMRQLMHRVLDLVNDNEGKPYRRKQAEKMIRYKKIITIYKNRTGQEDELHPAVRQVFEQSNSDEWDARLIACVPFLLASYQLLPTEEQREMSSEVEEIIQSHRDLFDFYSDVVLKDIDDFLVRSNVRRFRERPVEGSSFGRRRGSDPYKLERMEENYGNELRHNKRHHKALERVCVVSWWVVGWFFVCECWEFRVN